MDQTEKISAVPPRVRADVMRRLSEKLAAQADTSPDAVEPEHLVAGYLSDDPVARHRFVIQLERAFGIQIDGSRFDACRTVADLADALAQKICADGKPGRVYIVCYRDTAGRMVESHVRAPNHEKAIEKLRAEGLAEVLSVEREEDEDRDGRIGRHVHRSWTGCILPLLAALLVGGGIVAYYWWRRG